MGLRVTKYLRNALLFVVASIAVAPTSAAGRKPATAEPNPLRYTVKNVDGRQVKLSRYRGKVLLVVNVASKCGLTPQYAALERVYKKYKSKGLVILGFPSNDFGNQEPGTDKEIKEFCTSKYAVTFPIFSKVAVKGRDAAPLYAALTGEAPDYRFAGEIAWNFAKFLTNRKGDVVARFAPPTDPEAPEVIAAIERELAAKPTR